MKHLFKVFFYNALAVSLPLYATSVEFNYEEEMKMLVVQRKTLAESGLWGFFAVAQSNLWEAPKIHSQCWVDWLPREPAVHIQLEQAKRDFGLEIVKAMEGEALRILLPTNTVERANQADRLLRFANWVGGSDGYGNFAIRRRVEHLACIPIGHLVADLDFPVEKIEVLLTRFETEGGGLRTQCDILNEESPHKYDARTKDELAVQWHGHFRKAWFAYKEKVGRYPHSFSNGKNFSKEVAFYCEDETSPRPYTLSTQWSQKLHYIFCVMGYEDSITERVKTFLLFRKTIGRFPLKPSRPLETFPESEIQEGFYEAWKPYETKLGIHPGASGYTYEAIRGNTFMDYDTSELVSFVREKGVSDNKLGEDGKKAPE